MLLTDSSVEVTFTKKVTKIENCFSDFCSSDAIAYSCPPLIHEISFFNQNGDKIYHWLWILSSNAYNERASPGDPCYPQCSPEIDSISIPWSSLEMQALQSSPDPPESNSEVEGDPQVSRMPVKFEQHCSVPLFLTLRLYLNHVEGFWNKANNLPTSQRFWFH